MRRKVLPIIVLALATAGYSKHGHGEFKNPSTIYANPNHLSSWEQAYGNADDLEDRLTKLHGADAAKYGLQVVDNGTRIRESPDKQRYLYDTIERRLREKFPLISPPRLFGFIDEPREAENVAMIYHAREKVLSRARKDGIDLPISFIIAALSNEGHSLDVDSTSSYNDGFMMYGLDTFGSEFKRIVERGYLPASFRSRFTVTEHINETGRRVKSADFESRQDAFEAFIATLARRQYLFFEDLRKNKISKSKIPREQVLFFTYKYYNGGPNSAEGLLKKRSPKEIDRFFRRVITYGSTGNAYVVLAGSQWLDLSGAVDTRPQGKYWWSR